MLLQSHEGCIAFLPALPAAWKEGQVMGLRARGGFEVDLRWKEGQFEAARIKSNLGKACRVESIPGLRVLSKGAEVKIRMIEPGVVEFTTQAGDEYLLSA